MYIFGYCCVDFSGAPAESWCDRAESSRKPAYKVRETIMSSIQQYKLKECRDIYNIKTLVLVTCFQIPQNNE